MSTGPSWIFRDVYVATDGEGLSMRVLKVLRARSDLFFRLSGICLEDFEALVAVLHPIWLDRERQRL